MVEEEEDRHIKRKGIKFKSTVPVLNIRWEYKQTHEALLPSNRPSSSTTSDLGNWRFVRRGPVERMEKFSKFHMRQ